MALCLANGGASTNLGLKIFRVQEKGGRTDPWSGPGRPVLTFLSLTTRLAQTATATEMLIGTYKRRRRVRTSSNGTRGRLG
jgi:hypothetical protein